MAVDAPEAEGERPYWKCVFVSTTHCGSGCVIDGIIGAPIVFATGWVLLGERLYSEYAVEFVLAYPFGIAFQHFPIGTMRQIAPGDAVVDAVKADTLPLFAFEAGMFAWMAVIWFLLMPSHRPDTSNIVFWFMMQIGMVLGFLTTCPVNWLLVGWGVKSGM